MSREAEAATAVIRGMAERAHDVAALAAELEEAANRMEDAVRHQAAMLADARASLAANEPTILALGQSADSVASISALIARVARQSQLLALNARIEASRGGDAGRGFAAVAGEMSMLADQTKHATDDIAVRAGVITADVGTARAVVVNHAALVETQDGLLAVALDHAGHQRRTAVQLATITADTATAIDDAAAAVGRVGATAVAVKLLARQMVRTGSVR